MRGQTNAGILDRRLQRRLRSAPTDAERHLWRVLRYRQLEDCKVRRQHPYEDFILDFVCLERRLVVEVDGSQHLDSENDRMRDGALAGAGFLVLRFWNDQVLTETPAVVEAIVTALQSRAQNQNHPHPDPPLEGEGEERANADRRGE